MESLAHVTSDLGCPDATTTVTLTDTNEPVSLEHTVRSPPVAESAETSLSPDPEDTNTCDQPPQPLHGPAPICNSKEVGQSSNFQVSSNQASAISEMSPLAGQAVKASDETAGDVQISQIPPQMGSIVLEDDLRRMRDCPPSSTIWSPGVEISSDIRQEGPQSQLEALQQPIPFMPSNQILQKEEHVRSLTANAVEILKTSQTPEIPFPAEVESQAAGIRSDRSRPASVSDQMSTAQPQIERVSKTLVEHLRDDGKNEHEDEEDEDEDDIVTRPRSRSKRGTVVQDEEDRLTKRTKLKEVSECVPSREADVMKESVAAPAQQLTSEDDDEEGNTKVDEHGALLGDRTYTSKAFRLPTRGDTYYFLATEIARVSGYRDSYLLFHKNRNLKKLMTTEAEKAFLIQQELIPYSYRNRPIGVVKALSIFKTFGAKVVSKGRRVKDDYFAQRARDQGLTEDDFANEEDRPVEDRLYAQAEAQRRAEADADVVLASNAKSAVEYNTMLNHQRKLRQLVQRQHFMRIAGKQDVQTT